MPGAGSALFVVEFLADPVLQILQAPTHNTMKSRQRPLLDGLDQGLALFVIQLGLAARRLGIDQSFGTAGVEAQHLVADRLKTNSADPRRIAARPTVIDLCQSQKAS